MRLLWILAAAGAVWWSAHQPAPTGRLTGGEPVRYVPLVGDELFEKVTPGQCLPHVDEIVTHPNWSIGIAEGSWGCLGYYAGATYVIHSDGAVDYTRLGMTRRIELTAGELATVRMLGRFDCADPEHRGHTLTIGLGAPDPESGVAISAWSPAGDRLDDLLHDAVARYVEDRAWALHGATLHARIGRFRVDLAGRTLRVRRGHRVLATAVLEPEVYVDLLDAIVQGAWPRIDEPSGRGVLRAGGATYPFDLLYWSSDALAPITNLLDAAGA